MTLPSPVLKCELRPGASPDSVSAVDAAVGRSLPSDYRAVLQESDGFEGFVDDDDEVFVSFWSASDIAELNDAYSVQEFVPGVILLGTDGGDTGYGFCEDDGHFSYVAVPLVGMSREAMERLGESFDDFVTRLVQKG